MTVKLTADVTAYLDGMQRVERAMKRERRRVQAWRALGIILAIVSVAGVALAAIGLVSTAAW